MQLAAPIQVIEPRRFHDARGWFTETYSERAMGERGIDYRFIQDNHSLSQPLYTLRGLHLQTPPHAQAKLVRCIRGRVFDVAVDLRNGSPTFGGWTGTELSAENGRQFFIDTGFAHGFLTLEEECEVVYKVSDHYSAACERGLRWDDPAIGITWPLPNGMEPLLSNKDAQFPSLAKFDSPFNYDGRSLVALGMI